MHMGQSGSSSMRSIFAGSYTQYMSPLNKTAFRQGRPALNVQRPGVAAMASAATVARAAGLIPLPPFMRVPAATWYM